MSFGGRSNAPQAQTPPEVPGVGVQTSTSLSGTPIAVVLGTNRIPGNLIFFNDYKATTTTTSQGGGKGGGGDISSSTTTYSSSVSYGLSVGPIQGVAQIWKTSSTPLTPPNASANTVIQSGASGQAPWSYLTSKHADQALGYNGLATFNVPNLSLGSSASLPNFTFETVGRGIAARFQPFVVPPGAKAWSIGYVLPDTAQEPFSTIALIVKSPGSVANVIFDTSPAWCFAELLVNATWGVGLPADRIGDLTAYTTWCQAAGLFMSPALKSQIAARDTLRDWLDATISDAFFSEGKIKVMPYADTPVTGMAVDGSAVTYAPDMTPVMTIDDTLLLPGQADEGPVQMTVADPTDLYNQVAIEYGERSNAYNMLPALSQNDAHIAQYGLRPAPSLQADFITTGDVAHLIADLTLARHLGVQATYEWRMRSPGELLEPFDIVALSDPALGLVNYPVRVSEVEEEDDSVFHVTAEDIPGLIGPMDTRPIPVNAGFVNANNADPGPINVPVIFEPQGGLLTSGSGLEAWGAISGASPDWAGAQVWVSTDGETYDYLDAITGKARQGVLTAPLAAVDKTPNPPTLDNANTVSIDVSQSSAELLSTSQASMLALNTLCYVDGELIGYQNATLGAAAGLYGLTGLVRGVDNSTIAAHAAGTQFARLDQGIFKVPFTADRIGQTLYFKFLSFNTLGGALYTLDEVQPFAYTLRGTALTDPPPDVTGFASAYNAGLLKLIWNPVVDTRGRALDYEIRLGPNPATAMIVGRTPLTECPIIGDGTYWIAAHFPVPHGPDIYSTDWRSAAIAGSALVSNVIATYDAAADGWSGAKSGTSVIGGNLSLSGAGDILVADDVLSIGDVRYFGGVVATGSYTIPADARVTLTGPANCTVVMKLGAIAGYDTNAIDILTVTDITQLSDTVGTGLGNKVSVIPQINLSQDGSNWAGWQNWVLGSYTAKVFDARVLLATSDGSVAALLSGWTFAVDVPDRIDQYAGLVTSAVTGQIAQVFQPRGATSPAPFNGGTGPGNTPIATFSIANGQAGDDPATYTITGSQIVITTTHGGSPVSRQINNLVVQGY